jgi:DNA (cytosine-5)-methyltransferase 1
MAGYTIGARLPTMETKGQSEQGAQMDKEIKYAELFGGISGFRVGIEAAAKKLGIPAKCIFYNDFDRHAVGIHNFRFNEQYLPRDISTVKGAELAEVDLITAGFPCQSYSLSGHRMGLQDPRGQVIYELFRILKETRCPYILLENVKGLLSSEQGRAFAEILCGLDELGYDVKWYCPNAAAWVPQNRERIYLIGHLRERPDPKVLFEAVPLGDVQEKGRRWQVTSLAGEIPEVSPTITKEVGRGVGFHLVGLYGLLDRHLTNLEVERIMGFPDNFTAFETDGDEILPTPKTRRFECSGNAVVPQVVEFISKPLLEHIWKDKYGTN